ncbi:MAG: DNA-protecting protein DprA [Chloroflexi bacterium]|nr:DNA-protecting protein DprA [Chloroflexota bacterium]
MSDPRYWLAFNLAQGVGPVKTRALIAYFGDLQSAWQAGTDELTRAGLDRRAVDNIAQARATLDLDQHLARLERAETRLLTWDDPDYPERLAQIADPPPALYCRGEIRSEDSFAVAIVGTRLPTAYGKEAGRALATELARNRITIISGLARGIDLIAHQAALDAGGRTIAVLGSGVDVIYPPEARPLSEQIVQRGAIVSDYPLGTGPDGRNFPPRNRIISGMSLGTVVIEAGLDSGALITAAFALDQGREVFAVPGSIYSKTSLGANRLIQQGAKLVTRAEDILEELHLEHAAQEAASREVLPEDETERALYTALSQEPAHVDDLGRSLQQPVSAITATLTLMELKGSARHVGGMYYVRVS